VDAADEIGANLLELTLVLLRPGPELRRVLGLALHHLHEAGVVRAPAEQDLDVARLLEGRLAVEGLLHLVEPRSLLGTLAVGAGIGLGLEADDGDAAPVGRDPPRRPQVALGAGPQLALPLVELALVQIAILDLGFYHLNEHRGPLFGSVSETYRT